MTDEKQEMEGNIADKEAEISELEDKKRGYEDQDHEMEAEYDGYLDDFGDVVIGSLKYAASRVLKEVDEIAYNVGFSEWADEIITELEDEIDTKKGELEEMKAELAALKTEVV